MPLHERDLMRLSDLIQGKFDFALFIVKCLVFMFMLFCCLEEKIHATKFIAPETRHNRIGMRQILTCVALVAHAEKSWNLGYIIRKIFWVVKVVYLYSSSYTISGITSLSWILAHIPNLPSLMGSSQVATFCFLFV